VNDKTGSREPAGCDLGDVTLLRYPFGQQTDTERIQQMPDQQWLVLPVEPPEPPVESGRVA
jgi:hypothetical protein